MLLLKRQTTFLFVNKSLVMCVTASFVITTSLLFVKVMCWGHKEDPSKMAAALDYTPALNVHLNIHVMLLCVCVTGSWQEQSSSFNQHVFTKTTLNSTILQNS